MANTPFDQEMLDSLTDEERAGLLDPNFIDEGADEAARAAVEGAAADGDADGAGAEAGDADGDPDGGGDDPAATQGAADGQADPAAGAANPAAAETAPPPPPSLLPDWKLPEDFEAHKARIAQDEEALEQKFDDGEMTAAEYRTQLRALGDERAELIALKLKVDIAQDARQHDYQTHLDTWNKQTVPAWFERHQNYDGNAAAFEALNQEVRRLQGAAMDKYGETSSAQFAADILDQAHRNVQMAMRRALGLADEDPATPETKTKTPAQPSRELPPALGGLPNAAPASVEDTSHFAVISRMSGEAKEQAMAALSPTEYEAYLASPYA